MNELRHLDWKNRALQWLKSSLEICIISLHNKNAGVEPAQVLISLVPLLYHVYEELQNLDWNI